MSTAVVTTVHQRHAHLRNQIRGLQRSSGTPDIHIVVALGDPEVPDVVRQEGHGACVVECPGRPPLPLAAARNIGARAALVRGADLLIFLDVDCIPSEGLVGRYREVVSDPAHRDALLCGPVTYLPPAGPDDYDLTDLAARVRPHPARPWPPDESVQNCTDYALFWSLSFAVRGDTWKRIGGFCEQYVGYGGEDTDFARCAAARGVPMRWVGGAHAFHQHHPVEDPPVRHLHDIVRNARIYHHRWGSWPMGGWLEAFERLELITRRPDGTPEVLVAAGSPDVR